MANNVDPEHVLKDWVERDLTEECNEDRLPRVFGMEAVLARVMDVVASGKHPVLSGEIGVGKSALVVALAKEVQSGKCPKVLEGKRILQLSLRNRMSGLAKKEKMRPAMHKLVKALVALQDKIIPYFCDWHLIYDLDLEPQFELLAMRFAGPILCETDCSMVDMIFEVSPALEQYYVCVNIEEPDLEAMTGIVAGWEQSKLAEGRKVDPLVLSEVLQLTHRFLPRTRQPRKTLDLLNQVNSVVPQGELLSLHHVLERFQQVYHVPRFLIDSEIPLDLEATRSKFRYSVLGQDEAVQAIVRMVGMIKAGLSDFRRPFGTFLFVGPTGVGKTHIAQLLAEYLFGHRERLVRFNMADYQGTRDALVLFGDPDAFSMRQRRGLLTSRMIGQPFAVLLLDEFEKANPTIHDRFLQLVDEGAFVNGASETVSCRSLILIATSNAGSEIYQNPAIGFSNTSRVEELDRVLDRRLLDHFRAEFLNRFDQIVHFHPLDRVYIRTIARREIEQIEARSGLKTRSITLEVDEAVLDWLCEHGYDPLFGARFLKRAIERYVTTTIAELLVKSTSDIRGVVRLILQENQIVAVQEQPTNGATPRPQKDVAIFQKSELPVS
jgi:ATP-dependent Clp protease ATP-binding subunit ClpA